MRGLILPTAVVLFALTKGGFAAPQVPVVDHVADTASVFRLIRRDDLVSGMLFDRIAKTNTASN